MGDWVYLKLQPYVQTSLAIRANAKLAFRFFGPFLIEHRVGSLSYHLRLPAGCKLHPVFHVSQLRKGAPPGEVHKELPVVDDASAPHHVPEEVIKTRQVLRRQKTLEQVLVRWSGMPSSLATWENKADLRARFPRAPAWGQAAVEEGADVMSPSDTGPRAGPAQRPQRTKRDTGRYPTQDWTR